jgi:23S rRNA (guanosine2251-2'-O)-methyltransferase
VSAYPVCRLSDAIDRALQNTANPFFLLLDHILDPNNLGALVRTGLGFGVDGVLITKDRAALPTPAVSRVSAGALEHVQLIRIVNMVSAIKYLKAAGIWVLGMDRGKGRSILKVDLTGPVAIIIGGEEKGIRPLVKKHCDDLIALPQQGPLNSFNASVAGGIVMFEIFRQRQ